jgi:hypothetical protein
MTNVQYTLPTALSDFINTGGFGAQKTLKAVTFLDTVTPVALFTVTGVVLAQMIPVCTADLTSAAGCNASVGTTGTPAGLIALTDVLTIDAGEVWTAAAPVIGPKAPPAVMAIAAGEDIVLTLSAQVDAGAITFYCIWTPLSVGATVVAA